MPARPSSLAALFKRIRLPILIVAVTAGVIALLIATRPRLTPVEKPERVWPVDVVEARHADVRPDLELFGEIVAGRRSELRPLVSGLVVKIGDLFQEGALVAAGDLMLQIDPFDYRTDLAEQESLLREARARLEKLKRDHARAEKLFADDNVSEQFLDDARLAVIEQESLVEQRDIGVQKAKKALADTRLVAPFAGVLKDVKADLGQQFSGFGDDKVAVLIDTSRVEVRFSLSNAQYGRLLEEAGSLKGRPVQVIWPVGDRDMRFDATIERVGAEIASTTGGVDAFAVVDTGGEQTLLRPGAFVRVVMRDREYPAVLRLPDSALYGGDRVFVVEDGRLVAHRVRVEGYAGTDILIRAGGEPGIRDGQQIVVTQLREAGPGAKVSIR